MREVPNNYVLCTHCQESFDEDHPHECWTQLCSQSFVHMFPEIVFDNTAMQHLEDISEFIRNVSDIEVRCNIIEELYERLEYLNGYGGSVSDDDARRRFKVWLFHDWADLSFGIVWESLNKETNTYRHSMQGGLIWHGGSNDPLTVSLTKQYWGIHT